MNNGTIKWFNADRGSGFISNDNGNDDIFVHISSFKNKCYRFLQEGDKVTFDIEREPKSHRIHAINVKTA